MAKRFELKNDQYRRARGGTAELLNLSCTNCGEHLMIYQKDGPGHLMRCYLNRIFYPPELECLQRNNDIRVPHDLQNLVCHNCNKAIGYPMQYRDGRLAYRLELGAVARTRYRE